MAHAFVGTRIAFPEPLAVGGRMPFPTLRSGFVFGNKRARVEAGDTGNFLEAHQRLQSTLCFGSGVRLARYRVAIGLRAEIHRCPQSIVVAVLLDICG
jgi:hypothetical protein